MSIVRVPFRIQKLLLQFLEYLLHIQKTFVKIIVFGQLLLRLIYQLRLCVLGIARVDRLIKLRWLLNKSMLKVPSLLLDLFLQ